MPASSSVPTEAPSPSQTDSGGYVGRSIVRPEDVPLVRGEAEFVGDINRPGQLYARIVRSDAAHGRLLSVHTAEAVDRPGVVGVFTGADLPDVRIPIRMEMGDVARQSLATQPPLALDRVRYVGEPIAVVVAGDQPTAEDAAAHVYPELEELDAVTDAGAGATPSAVVLHDVLDNNVVDRLRWRIGRVDEALAQAAVVVREELYMQRHTGVPLETRGIVAAWDPELGRLTIWGAAKVKHFNRAALAGMLGLDEDRINLVESEVGGGFGVRGELYPEDFLIPWLSVRLERPVKWVEDRIEHLVATNHSREQTHLLEIGAAADGRLVALRDRISADMGAYVRTHGALVPLSTGGQIPGPYDWDAVEIEAELVLTNKTPTGTYRGPGGVEAAFVRERLLDRLAWELGLSPVELRRRNLIAPERFPLPVTFDEGLGGFTHDTGDYPGLWDTMLETSGYPDIQRDCARRRSAGELVGVGTAAFAEVAVIGPWEQARIIPEPEGRFRVALGVSSVGQGVRTALGQIAADALRVAFERIVIDYHSTDEVPFGFGAFASRVTTVGGNAVAVAADDLHRRSRLEAARRSGVSADEVEVDGDVVHCPRGEEFTLFELGCIGEGRFDKEELSVGFGAALAVVCGDPETGVTKVERLVLANDLGRPVNPMLVRGQLVGAAAQGVGGALLEQFVYDGNGQPLAVTLADYLLPTALDVPEIELVVSHVTVPNNPLGLGPAGENGIYGVAPAIANALADAAGERPGLFTRLPLTPESVWAALNDAPV
jgi:carbon-monoxide dehydrogenase large subunit